MSSTVHRSKWAISVPTLRFLLENYNFTIDEFLKAKQIDLRQLIYSRVIESLQLLKYPIWKSLSFLHLSLRNFTTRAFLT